MTGALALALLAVAALHGARAVLLRRGDRGDHVGALQRALRAAGDYRGQIDGRFGPETETALRVFQARAGLTVDGIAGPQVWSEIGRAGL